MKTPEKLRACILAPVATDEFNELLLQAVQPVLPPDVTVEVRNLPPHRGYTTHIQNRIDWLTNGPGVVHMAREVQADGFHGIWLSDFDMCGVEAAREAVDIPIIGGFPTSAFTALALSERFSIITILPSTLPMQRVHPQTYGVQDNFASIISIGCEVSELSDVEKVTDRTFKAAMEAVVRDQAQSILLGCTGFVNIAGEVSHRLQKALGIYVPVIDPNEAGFSFLVSLMRMKARQSRACYAKAE